MDVVRLWLARHGETAWNAEDRFVGWADLPLTGRGRRQAAGLRSELAGHEFAGVWSSDLSRAAETARIAWGPPRLDARLREMDLGAVEGRTWEELEPSVRERLAAFDGFDAPGGETFDSFRARVVAFLDELTPGDHLLVAHGGVIRLVLRMGGHGDRTVAPGSVVVVEHHEIVAPTRRARRPLGGQPPTLNSTRMPAS